MFASPLSAAPLSVPPSVTVRGQALILFLPQADSQTVWRFDLDSLTDHAFRLTGRDGYYELTLTDTTGLDMMLMRFLDKQDANAFLHAIHTALQNSSAGTDLIPASAAGSCKMTRCTQGVRRKLTFWRVIALIGLAALLWGLLSPIPFRVWHLANTPDPLTAALPSGVPLDADSVLPR